MLRIASILLFAASQLGVAWGQVAPTAQCNYDLISRVNSNTADLVVAGTAFVPGAMTTTLRCVVTNESGAVLFDHAVTASGSAAAVAGTVTMQMSPLRSCAYVEVVDTAGNTTTFSECIP